MFLADGYCGFHRLLTALHLDALAAALELAALHFVQGLLHFAAAGLAIFTCHDNSPAGTSAGAVASYIPTGPASYAATGSTLMGMPV